MAKYLGKNWKKAELLAFIGDPAQVAGATPFVLSDGKAEGVKGIRVDTGGGLAFTVLPGRGMDIAEASFRAPASPPPATTTNPGTAGCAGSLPGC
jgi:hypothetical protein